MFVFRVGVCLILIIDYLNILEPVDRTIFFYLHAVSDGNNFRQHISHLRHCLISNLYHLILQSQSIWAIYWIKSGAAQKIMKRELTENCSIDEGCVACSIRLQLAQFRPVNFWNVHIEKSQSQHFKNRTDSRRIKQPQHANQVRWLREVPGAGGKCESE